MEFKIPESFNVGGVTVNINHVERCDNNALGNCLLAASRIEIADLCNKDTKQSESNKLNTLLILFLILWVKMNYLQMKNLFLLFLLF